MYYSKEPADIKVIAGTIDLKDARSTHEVEDIIIHESYNPRDSWKNDIALVKVRTHMNVHSNSSSFHATKLHPSNFTICSDQENSHRDCFSGERSIRRV